MKAQGLAFLLCCLAMTAAAELNGLPPQRRAELERLMSDTPTLRGEALATSRALEFRFRRADITLSLRDTWRQIEAVDAQTHDAGDHLRRQIEQKLGEGRMSASVASDLQRCVDDSVAGRRVLIYGYLWPQAITEMFEESRIALPDDLRARLELKATRNDIQPLAFSECGAVMRGYGVFPLNP